MNETIIYLQDSYSVKHSVEAEASFACTKFGFDALQVESYNANLSEFIELWDIATSHSNSASLSEKLEAVDREIIAAVMADDWYSDFMANWDDDFSHEKAGPIQDNEKNFHGPYLLKNLSVTDYTLSRKHNFDVYENSVYASLLSYDEKSFFGYLDKSVSSVDLGLYEEAKLLFLDYLETIVKNSSWGKLNIYFLKKDIPVKYDDIDDNAVLETFPVDAFAEFIVVDHHEQDVYVCTLISRPKENS